VIVAKVILSLGNDISTDVIYPGRYMATVLPTETPQFAFADNKEVNELLTGGKAEPGSIIVAGENFGCGSSREQAVSTLKGHELIIVARSIARIFLQNAINLGLRVYICPAIDAQENDDLTIQESGVRNNRTGKPHPTVPLPRSRQSIIDAGGLIAYTRKRLLKDKGVPAV
jgi:3-isopropylmalate/(R)-2-methylmalate dehydratase small subunit